MLKFLPNVGFATWWGMLWWNCYCRGCVGTGGWDSWIVIGLIEIEACVQMTLGGKFSPTSQLDGWVKDTNCSCGRFCPWSKLGGWVRGTNCSCGTLSPWLELGGTFSPCGVVLAYGNGDCGACGQVVLLCPSCLHLAHFFLTPIFKSGCHLSLTHMLLVFFTF